jgi:hypothetical protein
MGASIKTVPDVGRSQQAGRWGNAAFPPFLGLSLLCATRFGHLRPSDALNLPFFDAFRAAC